MDAHVQLTRLFEKISETLSSLPSYRIRGVTCLRRLAELQGLVIVRTKNSLERGDSDFVGRVRDVLEGLDEGIRSCLQVLSDMESSMDISPSRISELELDERTVSKYASELLGLVESEESGVSVASPLRERGPSHIHLHDAAASESKPKDESLVEVDDVDDVGGYGAVLRGPTECLGRQAEVKEAVEFLSGDDGLLLCVIHGRSGVGKTTTALKIASDLAKKGFLRQFFVDLAKFSGRESCDGIRRVAELVSPWIEENDLRAFEDRRCILRFFEQAVTGPRTVILLDNASSEDDIYGALPREKIVPNDIAVIITSEKKLSIRRHLIRHHGQLLKPLQESHVSAVIRNDCIDVSAAETKRLIELFPDDLMASLILLGVFKGDRTVPFGEVMDKVDKNLKVPLIEQVVRISYDRLSDRLKTILQICCVFPCRFVESDVLSILKKEHKVSSEDDELWKIGEDVGMLVLRNLLQFWDGTFFVHDVIRRIVTDFMRQVDASIGDVVKKSASFRKTKKWSQYDYWRRSFSEWMSQCCGEWCKGIRCLKRGIDVTKILKEVRAHFPMLMVMKDYVYDRIVFSDDDRRVPLLLELSYLLRIDARFSIAKEILNYVRETEEKQRGANSESVGRVILELAQLESDMANFPEAESLFKRSIGLLGEGTDDVAMSKYLLGMCYVDQKKVDEAYQCLEDAADFCNAHLDENHDILSSVLIGLGYVSCLRKEYDPARDHLEKALEKIEARGEPEADTALALSNLALVYDDEKDVSKAVPAYERAIVSSEVVYGQKHPEVATLLNNMALLFVAERKFPEAQSALERAVNIYEDSLGPYHLDVATSLNNLGICLKAQGKYVEAERSYRRVLQIRQIILGPEHVEIAAAFNNLALVLKCEGIHEEAEKMYRKALEMQQNLLGPEHDDVASTLLNAALFYKVVGSFEKAESRCQRALEIEKKIYGDDSMEVAAVLNCLGGVLHSAVSQLNINILGKITMSEGEGMMKRKLMMGKQNLGNMNEDVVDSVVGLLFGGWCDTYCGAMVLQCVKELEVQQIVTDMRVLGEQYFMDTRVIPHFVHTVVVDTDNLTVDVLSLNTGDPGGSSLDVFSGTWGGEHLLDGISVAQAVHSVYIKELLSAVLRLVESGFPLPSIEEHINESLKAIVMNCTAVYDAAREVDVRSSAIKVISNWTGLDERDIPLYMSVASSIFPAQ